MGKFFDLDSPLMQVLNKLADLMWLNILTFICSIPIFTIGASLTAAHYVALKIRRNEEGYISKEFFKSFKMNFKQATLTWLLILVMVGILAGDFYIMNKNPDIEIHYAIRILLMSVGILVAFTVTWIFPMQARFSNTIKGTIKNAFAVSILQFPKTILMIIMYAVPVVLFITDLRVFPVVFLFGISAPVYVSALLYNKTFKRLETQILEAEGGTGDAAESPEEEEEKIFKDQSVDE